MLDLDYARRSRRHHVDMLCELIRADCDEPINHRIVDISAYGMWIQTSFPMADGAQVVIVLSPPSADDIIVFGRVSRARKRGRPLGALRSSGGMGIEFVGVTASERLQLLMWLRQVPDDAVRVLEFGRMVH